MCKKSEIIVPHRKWHFGCGRRHFKGWLNTDKSINLGRRLPFPDDFFDVAVGQHVIEHFNMKSKGLALLRELRRVIVKNTGTLYLSCPDIKKICEAYCSGQIANLISGRKRRFSFYSLKGAPETQFINDIFYQSGEHKSLYDFKLLSYVLSKAGWAMIKEIEEKDLLDAEPDILPRNDGEQTLYVKAQ